MYQQIQYFTLMFYSQIGYTDLARMFVLTQT